MLPPLSRNTALGALSVLTLLMPCGAYSAQPTEDYPVVKLQTLDKITARTDTFEARVGSTVKFGPLYVKVQACRKTSPIELPEAAAFLQVWEIVRDTDTIAANALASGAEKGKPQWVFSGWMFASSPALSPMDHPVYDVWVIDCLQDQKAEKAEDELSEGEIENKPDETPEEAAAQKEEEGEISPVSPVEDEPVPEEEPPPTSPDIQAEDLDSEAAAE
ncbi:MAG: DUF2155 domain-containing protein [Alphaproteobacteria bacterium]|nr:DUF2155 domain-containing protein [Alphaproteobacteria bacterium]